MLNSDYFSQSNDQNRKRRELKYNLLVRQINDLLAKNYKDLTYLADGSDYKLTFSINCEEED